MNQDTLVEIGSSLFDAFTRHDASLRERALADDFVADYPCAPKLDRAAARAYDEPFVSAFPDIVMKAGARCRFWSMERPSRV